MNVIVLHSEEALHPPVDPVVAQVSDTMRSLGHDVRSMALGPDLVEGMRALRDAAPELVFNLAESFHGRSALESGVASLLSLLDLHYTGSSQAGLLLAGDKALAKKILQFHSVRTPEFATVFRGDAEWVGRIEFPLIVKPPQEDGSIGITTKSVVRNVSDLLRRMDDLQGEFNAPVLVEQFVEGRELYVGVLGNTDPVALPVMEMSFEGFPAGRDHVASWEAKWGTDGSGEATAGGQEFEGTRSVFPEDLPESVVKDVQRMAVETFTALRLRDYARIDFRVTPSGDAYVLEVNPNCYLERTAEFARAAERSGMTYDALIARIVELAAARYAR